MEKKLREFRTADIFSATWPDGVSEKTLSSFCGLCETIRYSKETTLYAQGEAQDYIWGVRKGLAKHFLAMNEAEPVLGHIFHAGAWFGIAALGMRVGGLAELQASQDAEFVRISHKSFRALANARPDLWEAAVRLVSLNQLTTMAAANDLTLSSPRGRLGAALLRLSGHRHAFQEVLPIKSVPVIQSEIAPLANLALSNLSVRLKEFESEGLVELGYGEISILNVDRLQGLIGK